jgi:hypothetical protein
MVPMNISLPGSALARLVGMIRRALRARRPSSEAPESITVIPGAPLVSNIQPVASAAMNGSTRGRRTQDV